MKLKTFFLYYSVAAFLLSGVFLCAQPQASPPSAKTDDALELVKQGQKLNSEGKQDEALPFTTVPCNSPQISFRQTWQREWLWIWRANASKRASIWQRPSRKPRLLRKFRR